MARLPGAPESGLSEAEGFAPRFSALTWEEAKPSDFFSCRFLLTPH